MHPGYSAAKTLRLDTNGLRVCREQIWLAGVKYPPRTYPRARKAVRHLLTLEQKGNISDDSLTQVHLLPKITGDGGGARIVGRWGTGA